MLERGGGGVGGLGSSGLTDGGCWWFGGCRNGQPRWSVELGASWQQEWGYNRFGSQRGELGAAGGIQNTVAQVQQCVHSAVWVLQK